MTQNEIKNTGKDYEVLTQIIFNEIVNQNSVETIDVQHNIILQGKDTKHQIDVYWEFKHVGIDYCTVVEAKDWQSPVNQEKLLAFKSVLQDLPKQPRGIYVTKTGYQKGALDVAKSNGIELFELREYTEEDSKGKIKTIILNIEAFMPNSQIIGFEIDNEWCTTYLTRNKISKIDVRIEGDPECMYILNENGDNIKTIKSLVDELYPSEYIEIPITVKDICFSVPTFIKTSSEEIPIVKINKISVQISVSKTTTEYCIESDAIISFILKNVVTNEERLVKNDLTLLR